MSSFSVSLLSLSLYNLLRSSEGEEIAADVEGEDSTEAEDVGTKEAVGKAGNDDS